jgi:hypothetical protein
MLLGEKACGLFIEFRIGAHEQEEFLDQLSDLGHASTHNTLFPKMDSLGMDQLCICHIILL